MRYSLFVPKLMMSFGQYRFVIFIAYNEMEGRIIDYTAFDPSVSHLGLFHFKGYWALIRVAGGGKTKMIFVNFVSCA